MTLGESGAKSAQGPTGGESSPLPLSSSSSLYIWSCSYWDLQLLPPVLPTALFCRLSLCKIPVMENLIGPTLPTGWSPLGPVSTQKHSCGHTVGGTAEPSTVAWGRCWLSLFLKILIYLSLPGLSCSTWDFTAKSSRATAEILHATSLFLFIYSFQFFFLFLFFVNSQLFSFSLNPFWDPTLFIPGLSSQKKSGLPKSYFGVNSFTCSSGTYEF